MDEHWCSGRRIFRKEKSPLTRAPKTRPVQAGMMIDFPLNGDQSRFAAPQLVLPFVAFQMPTTVLALVHAGAVVLLSVGAAAALP